MRRHLIATAVLVPAAALATALPAQAQWAPVQHKSDNGIIVSAAAVSGRTLPGAAPMRQLRSSTQRCAGTVVSRTNALYQGKVAGVLTIYYKSANGGTITSCFAHAGVTKGKRLPTSVALVGARTVTAKPGVVVAAYGNFTSWAGPAALGGMNGKCVQAAGVINYLGKAITAQSPALCDA